MKTNQDVSIEIQQKFEFYFLSLVFVLLGLSIQTAKIGNYQAQDLIEICGWVCFFISGISGLSRMEWLSPVYKGYHLKQKSDKQIDEAENRMAMGDYREAILNNHTTIPIQEVSENQKKIKKKSKRN
ncbi:MAG: hypothetical protein KAR45_22800 [Desulfobacteraceae bacterium]|nr:hypothetical protein [Desulfobacteraceae bacterium]